MYLFIHSFYISIMYAKTMDAISLSLAVHTCAWQLFNFVLTISGYLTKYGHIILYFAL